MEIKKKILFISHDANRVGAPILLLNLAQLVKEIGTYEISFLIKNEPFTIIEEFQKYNCYEVQSSLKKFSNSLWKLTQKISITQKLFLFNQRKIRKSLEGIDIVISNTITNGDILPIVRKFFNGPIFTYIHELEISSKVYSTEKDLNSLLNISTGFLYPSNAVKKFWQSTFNINSDKLKYLPYYIPNIEQKENEKTKNKLSIGGIGTTEWRKGTDLFLQLAGIFKREYPLLEVEFIWKGYQDNLEFDRINYDIKKQDLNNIQFLKNDAQSNSFYESIDILLLLSREDPYPLVTLEAANFSIPTICFKKAGGIPEFIEEFQCGVSVDYLDLNAVTKSILDYVKNLDLLSIHGNNAKKGLKLKHQSKEVILEYLKNAIK